MDKNVSSVDLDELMKAREELDREKGVETDPNMYSDYNPNREESEETQENQALENNNYENITDNSSEQTQDDSVDEKSSAGEFNDDYSIGKSSEETSSEDEADKPKDLSNYSMFAAFEVNDGKSLESPTKTETQSANVGINVDSAASESPVESEKASETVVEEQPLDMNNIMSSIDDIFDKLDSKEETAAVEEEKTAEVAAQPESNTQDDLTSQGLDDFIDKIKADFDASNKEEETAEELEEVESKAEEEVSLEEQEPQEIKPAVVENEAINEPVEVITDFNQLKTALQKELEESEKAAEEKIEDQQDEKVRGFAQIEDFKFINEIASDEFKSSHSLSYLIGKDENDERVYGNFKEHYNLAVFGKNTSVTNSFVNTMILSLCLKNSYQDINFVLLDYNINSMFEVYNQSSYLFFNRIAKTNKEILDTLLEISKEIDDRYEKLAEIGVKNIEQYNQTAKENGFSTLPNVVVVFNNYTKSTQSTDNDKINACLYQVLKYGRIVGFNAMVVAKVPIELDQINFSLSSRINFKYNDDSTYTIGVSGADKLIDDNDALFFDISTNEVKHVKIPTISDTELDLIIKDLEE